MENVSERSPEVKQDSLNVFEGKPWLDFYDEHVPPTIEYPQLTMPAVLAEMANKYPFRPAIIFKDNAISYRDFNRSVDRFAAAFKEMGLEKGDRVAIHLPNCPQFPIAYYAALRCGAIAVPCNPVYTARELSHQLVDSGAIVAVTLSNTYRLIKQIRDQTRLEHVIVAKIKSYFPAVTRLLFTLLLEGRMGHKCSIDGNENTYWFYDVLENAPEMTGQVPLNWEDTAVLMYTGGTTGISKGAQLTHKNIFVNAYQTNIWVKGEEGRESTLSSLPFFHSYGMTTCMNVSVLSAGAMILVPDPRNVKDIVKTAHKHRPTYYPGVPALYNAVNNFPGIEKYDLSSIKSCASGAAPLPLEVQQKFQAITGARLGEGYGLSETSPVTHGNPTYGDNRLGTVGVPWPDTEVKIVDIDSGELILGYGEEGEICIRGPQVMKGYWNMPTETANALRPDPEGGDPWFFTGDIGTMDEDGYFRIVDRKKDMILGAGGFNIYPREIEDALYEHPAVLEAAAAGVPVPGKGERPKAFVVLKAGQQATEEELLAFLEERLAIYKRPKMVEFRDELPKTNTGKILRRKLVEEAKAQIGDTG